MKHSSVTALILFWVLFRRVTGSEACLPAWRNARISELGLVNFANAALHCAETVFLCSTFTFTPVPGRNVKALVLLGLHQRGPQQQSAMRHENGDE